MVEGEGRHVLVTIQPPFWALYCELGLQLHLTISCLASLAGPKMGHCIRAVVQRSLGDVGEDVRRAARIKATRNSLNGCWL